LCLDYVSKYSGVIRIFLHKVFQFCNTASLTLSKSCTVFSTWFSHTHFDLCRDVSKYFIYAILVTSHYSFICSFFIYVQRIVFQHFVPHFCVSVLFRNICMSLLFVIVVGHLPSSTDPPFPQTFSRNHANPILSLILPSSSCVSFCFLVVCAHLPPYYLHSTPFSSTAMFYLPSTKTHEHFGLALRTYMSAYYSGIPSRCYVFSDIISHDFLHNFKL